MRGGSPSELAGERRQLVLDQVGRRFLVRVLEIGALVAAPAEDEAGVRRLLPVIESPTRVVRAGIEHPTEGLGRNHLSADRPDRLVELRNEPARVPIGRDHDSIGLDVVQ